ncbi:MAG: sensor histidine kinase [Chloroflexi bacterium]|nr:sensor histidine kinase [Chloroflexota bacterium]
MNLSEIVVIYFVYGLAFFSMGLAVILEGGRATDARLRHGLQPLAAFGIIHGIHEWLELLDRVHALPGQQVEPLGWQAVRLAFLTFSFLSLSAFGGSLLSPTERIRRLSLLAPLLQAAAWGIGVFVLKSYYPPDAAWKVAEVWARYVIAIPAALLASAGLVAQQRVFRQAGLTGFGRDSLWAAVAFAWYGLVGQSFTIASPLPPSLVFNQDLFLRLFGVPVQLVRALSAIVAAVFIIRFLRSFDVETRRHIAELQAARLEEARRREELRGELLRRVVTAQEAERQRIARELHDATGQALTALGLGLRGVASSFRSDSDQTPQRLRQLETLASSTLDELRQLIADLRPPHLDDLGLASTLRWYAKDLQNHAPLEVTVEIVGDERPLNSAIKIALFRVAQEALNNVIKHSGAEHARVQLEYQLDAVRLRVEDDGCGFDVAGPIMGRRASWGLLGMQERAALLGGQFRVESQPGAGTQVEMVIPYWGAEELA